MCNSVICRKNVKESLLYFLILVKVKLSHKLSIVSIVRSAGYHLTCFGTLTLTGILTCYKEVGVAKLVILPSHKNPALKKGTVRNTERQRTQQRSKERGWSNSVRLIQARDSGEVLFWLHRGRCVYRQDAIVSVAQGNRLKFASLPPALSQFNMVAQGDGF